MVMMIGCIAATNPFFYKHNKKVHVGLELIYFLFAFMSAIFMVVALWKIRSFLKERGLGNQMIIPLRVIVYAIAFLLSLFVNGIIKIAEADGTDLYYLQWFVAIIVGFIYNFCLFYVIWHLGSKDEVQETNATRSTTLNGDDIMQYVPIKKDSVTEV